MIGFQGFDTIEAMAEHVLSQAPDRFALAGHSMGGRVALEVYRRAPARVARLALLNTGIHPQKEGEKEKRYRLVALAQESGMAAVADEWLPPMLAPHNRAKSTILSPLREMILRYTPDTFKGQIDALLDRPDAKTILPTIRIPTLFMSATEDSWSPVRQHEEMRDMVEGSRLVIIDDAGHFAPFEKPEAVATALSNWLLQEEVQA